MPAIAFPDARIAGCSTVSTWKKLPDQLGLAVQWCRLLRNTSLDLWRLNDLIDAGLEPNAGTAEVLRGPRGPVLLVPGEPGPERNARAARQTGVPVEAIGARRARDSKTTCRPPRVNRHAGRREGCSGNAAVLGRPSQRGPARRWRRAEAPGHRGRASCRSTSSRGVPRTTVPTLAALTCTGA